MSPKHLSVGAKRSKIPIKYHDETGDVLLSLEDVIRLLSPGLTPEEMLARYKQVVKLNPLLGANKLPDFSMEPAECEKETCGNCGSECSKSKSRCGPCMQSSLRVYYCSKECQKAHWPVHKPCCAQTVGILNFDGADFSNLVKAPLRLIFT